MAKNNVQSVSCLLCTQVIKPKIIQKQQYQSCTQIYVEKKKNNKNKQTNKQTNKKKLSNIEHKIFEELVPLVLPLLKKAHKARTRWYRGPFRRFINTRF